MDRPALLTAQSALLEIRRTVVLNHGPTDSFDHALSSIREALTSTSAAHGTTNPEPSQTKWVTTAEAAKVLGKSQRWVRDMAPRIGGVWRYDRWLIPQDSLPTEEQ